MCNIFGETVLFSVKMAKNWSNMNEMEIDKRMKSANINRFVTRKVSVLHFLALTLFFEILLIVFTPPMHILRYTTQLTAISPLMQISGTFAAGYLVLVISRLLLSREGLRRTFSAAGVSIWLFAELIVCVAVMSLAVWLFSGSGKLVLGSLAGDFLLYLIVVEIIPYAISYLLFLLHEEHDEVERLRALLPPDPADDPSVADQSVKFYDKGGRLALATLRENVLYIEAANNYTNIHYMNDGREETFILHNSLKELEQRLRGTSLVRCHRGFIVNVDCIKLMRKDGMGFQLELTGTQRPIPVTKTYSDALAVHIRIE